MPFNEVVFFPDRRREPSYNPALTLLLFSASSKTTDSLPAMPSSLHLKHTVDERSNSVRHFR